VWAAGSLKTGKQSHFMSIKGGYKTMLYILITIIAVIMAGATLCACRRSGEKENICKYDNLED
jgi:hypothetical protein